MRGGFMGRMLFVDLSSGRMREEGLSDEDARAFLGGYGLGAKILYERLPKGAPWGRKQFSACCPVPSPGHPCPSYRAIRSWASRP